MKKKTSIHSCGSIKAGQEITIKPIKKVYPPLKSLERFVVTIGTKENMSGFSQPTEEFCVIIGNITIRNPRSKRKGRIHITTGRADSLEGGEFKVSELEKAIQDFFDKNF